MSIVNLGMDHNIHVANNIKQPIKVIVTPNKDFMVLDVGFSIATSVAITAFSGGTAAGVAAAKTVYTFKTLEGIYNLLKLLKQVYGYYSKLQKISKAAELAEIQGSIEEITKFLNLCAITIQPDEFKNVNKKLMGEAISNIVRVFAMWANPVNIAIEAGKAATGSKCSLSVKGLIDSADIINPSSFAAFIDGVKNMTLFIATGDLKKVTCFNVNSDSSWIVKDDIIARPKSGTIWQEDPSRGYEFFGIRHGDKLASKHTFYVNDSLYIETMNIDAKVGKIGDILKLKDAPKGSSFLTKTGNWVLNTGRDVVNTPVRLMNDAGSIYNAAVSIPNIGSYPRIMVYRSDGNLAIYKLSGSTPKLEWETGTSGSSAGKVCMQDDGNFVVYDAAGKVKWALWKEMPAGHEDSFVKLDKISGKLGYHKNGSEKASFWINETKTFFKP